jgi:hypothetical protein
MGSDWANNVIYASSSAYKLTPRFKIAQKMVNGALKNIRIINSNLLDIRKVLYYLDYCQIKH